MVRDLRNIRTNAASHKCKIRHHAVSTIYASGAYRDGTNGRPGTSLDTIIEYWFRRRLSMRIYQIQLIMGIEALAESPVATG
jgi:hypothetical protein